MFVIFAQASIPPQPTLSSLDYPTSRHDLEAPVQGSRFNTRSHCGTTGTRVPMLDALYTPPELLFNPTDKR